MKWIKWKSNQVVNEYRVDEVERGHGKFQNHNTNNWGIGFAVVQFFAWLVVLALSS